MKMNLNNQLNIIALGLGLKPDNYYSAIQKMGKCNDGMKAESCRAVGNSM